MIPDPGDGTRAAVGWERASMYTYPGLLAARVGRRKRLFAVRKGSDSDLEVEGESECSESW